MTNVVAQPRVEALHRVGIHVHRIVSGIGRFHHAAAAHTESLHVQILLQQRQLPVFVHCLKDGLTHGCRRLVVHFLHDADIHVVARLTPFHCRQQHVAGGPDRSHRLHGILERVLDATVAAGLSEQHVKCVATAVRGRAFPFDTRRTGEPRGHHCLVVDVVEDVQDGERVMTT